MVTGVDNAIGMQAVGLLASRGGEVRVFVQQADEDPDRSEELAAGYRRRGCKVALGQLDDEAHVETAFEQVHTVLHLLGRPSDDPDRYLEHTATVVGAAIGAGCRRMVLLSDLAVSSPLDNPWLDALAQAEDLVADAPLESLVLRCAVIHGSDDLLTSSLAAGVLGAKPQGAHWPVAATDVARTAVLADAERDLDTNLHVVVPLTGPLRLSTASFASQLAAGVPTQSVAPLPVHAMELMNRVIERPDDALGLHGATVQQAWSV
ncbi:MAG: SDR family oxidoreductase [Euzebya sp.]